MTLLWRNPKISVALCIMASLLAVLLAPPLATKAQGKADQTEIAIFAGGCFWCVEADFDKVPGVLETLSGYTGGHLESPTYKAVSKGGTGHIESVQITFNPALVSYERLVHLFWRSVDPLDSGGQFCDRGQSYQTAIFVLGDSQRKIAEASKKTLTRAPLSWSVTTPVRDAATFWPAEAGHQNYHSRNKLRYKYYRRGCGRDKRVKALWGDEAWAS